jgi:hypothetical protein
MPIAVSEICLNQPSLGDFGRRRWDLSMETEIIQAGTMVHDIEVFVSEGSWHREKGLQTSASIFKNADVILKELEKGKLTGSLSEGQICQISALRQRLSIVKIKIDTP